MRIMEYETKWLEETGLDIRSGLEYTGRMDRYLSAIWRFYKNYEKNRTNTEAFLADGDYENYLITVHALKSNAGMIGAAELSKSFEELELAAKNGDIQTIREKHAPAMEDYRELIGKLAPVNELGQVRATDEISAQEARATAEELLAALDDFDDELSAQLAQKLTGYPFRITQRDKLKEAIACIEEFMYDEAASLIEEIRPAIE